MLSALSPARRRLVLAVGAVMLVAAIVVAVVVGGGHAAGDVAPRASEEPAVAAILGSTLGAIASTAPDGCPA